MFGFCHAWKIGNYMGLFKGSNQPLQQLDILKMYSLLFIYYFFLGTVKPNHQMRILYMGVNEDISLKKEERQRILNTFLLFFDMKSKLNFDTEHKKCT